MTKVVETKQNEDLNGRAAIPIEVLDHKTAPRSISSTQNDSNFETKKLYFAVDGMTCGVCSGTIETALKSTNGIIDAGVSHVNKLARVIFNPKLITSEQIIETISSVGFDAELQKVESETKTILLTQKLIPDNQKEEVETFVKELSGVLKVSIEAVMDERIRAYTSRLDIEFEMRKTGPRTLIHELSNKGFACTLFRSKGSLEIRKDEMLNKSQAEIRKHSGTLLWSLFFTLPVLFINMICPYIPILHYWLQCPIYNGFRIQGLLLWLLVTPVQFYLGRHFYTASYHSIKNRSASMDVLIMLGSTAAYIYSTITMFLCMLDERYTGPMFFETSAVLISIVLLGRCVEHKAKGKTSDALTALMSLQVPRATIVDVDVDGRYGKEEVIDTNLVQYGDIIKVNPGEKMPVDGILIRGKTTVDESLVTGESMPVTKDLHQTIIGSTVNLDSTIYFKATGIGSDTMLSKIAQLVDDAQTSKAPIQAYADTIAKYFVPIVVFLSIVTFTTWMILFRYHLVPSNYLPPDLSDILFSFMFGIAVLVISCPCSLGLATPTAVYVASLVGVKNGILFRGGQPLEETRKISKILFDKTGTLTQGKPSVNSNQTLTMHKELKLNVRELWSILGTAEMKSDHLLGKAIVTFAKEFLGVTEFESPEDYKSTTGAGIIAKVKGRNIVIGSLRFMSDNSIGIDASILEKILPMQDEGHIVVCAGIDKKLAAVICISDALRPEAKLVIQHLHQRKIGVYLVTGDHERSANAVAKALGIPKDCVRAQILPQKKAEIVQEVQESIVEQYHLQYPKQNLDMIRNSRNLSKVAFVGDGVNDAPALAKADIGMAMRCGTDIAVEAAQIVLNRNDLTDVLVAIDLSNKTMFRIKLNFMWAFLYNVCAIPYAAGAFYPFNHTQLSPMIAATLMFVSSISVVASSYLLNRFHKKNYNSISSDDLNVQIRVIGGQIFNSVPMTSPSLVSHHLQPDLISEEESPLSAKETKFNNHKNSSESIDWQPLRARHVSISGHSEMSDNEEEIEDNEMEIEDNKMNPQVELMGLLQHNTNSNHSLSSEIDYMKPTTSISQSLKNKISAFNQNQQKYYLPAESSISPLVTTDES